MKKTYKEYLEANNIISEEEFLEAMEWLPDVDIDLNKVDWCDYMVTIEDLCHDIINEILTKWDYAFVDEVDWNSKSLVIGDIKCIEDLKEIKELFSKWDITNYDDLEEQLLEKQKENQERIIQSKKDSLLNKLGSLIDIDEIQSLVNKYDNKK